MTQKFSKLSLFCLLILPILWFASCAEEGIIQETPRVSIPEPQELVTATLYGQVLDETGAPIPDANVTFRSGLTPMQVVTDEDGYFLIEDVDNKGRAAYVSVTYPGKFEAFRKFSLVAYRNNYTEIKMMDRDVIGTIESATGGTLTQDDGASIDLPANGIVRDNGQTYVGEVSVAMSWIDPSAEDLSQRMVGDLSGVDLDGNLRSLSSMGMLQVELIASDGSLLNLGNDQTAELTFPIPASLLSDATSSIPLWSYDELEGTWIQEGEAQLEGDTYIGEVSHFSSWNVDFMTDPIEITGQVKWEVEKDPGQDTTIGGSYLQVYVCSDNIGRKGGWLCEDGSFRFYNFPKDEKFQLKVYDKCGNEIYVETYGPYSNDEDLGMIIVETNEDLFVRISGNALNCDGDPVTNGTVIVSQGENADHYPLNENGEFEIGYAYCEGFDIGVEIIDYDNAQGSGELIITNGESNAEFKDTRVCEELENFISLDIEGIGSIILTPWNYLTNFGITTGADSLGIADTLTHFTILHESEDQTNRATFYMTFEIPQDYESNPNFDLGNVPVFEFSYASELLECYNFEEAQIIISFTTFEPQFEGTAAGTFTGTIKCSEDFAGGTERNISGSFKMPVR